MQQMHCWRHSGSFAAHTKHQACSCFCIEAFFTSQKSDRTTLQADLSLIVSAAYSDLSASHVMLQLPHCINSSRSLFLSGSSAVFLSATSLYRIPFPMSGRGQHYRATYAGYKGGRGGRGGRGRPSQHMPAHLTATSARPASQCSCLASACHLQGKLPEEIQGTTTPAQASLMGHQVLLVSVAHTVTSSKSYSTSTANRMEHTRTWWGPGPSPASSCACSTSSQTLLRRQAAAVSRWVWPLQVQKQSIQWL